MGITSITVAGFKSIRRAQTIELRPLTILAGANNSGKSSIMQPLLLMKQTLEAPFDPGALKLDGPNTNFDHTHQLLFRHGSVQMKGFRVSMTLTNTLTAAWEFRKSRKSGLDLTRFAIEGMSLRMGMTDMQIQKSLLSRTLELPGRRWAVNRDRCVLVPVRDSSNGDGVVRVDMGSGQFVDAIRRTVHVPSDRTLRERTFRSTAVGDTYPGVFPDYAASVVMRWQEGYGVDQTKNVAAALRTLGLGSRLEAKRVSDTRIEVLVASQVNGSAKKGSLLNVADVGLGVSQVFPILVALIAAGEGDLVYIEEPEIHLHPKAQLTMARVLVAAAKRGVIVVAETHSDLILRGIQTIVARRELPADQVRLHWFSRNPKDGATRVKTADMDQDGAFGDWPADFDDVSWGAAKEYLDAVEGASAR